MAIKVLILMDSFRFAENLRALIPWEDLDFEIVGMEYNGVLGLEQFRLFEPQIVVLDSLVPIIGVEEFIQAMRQYTMDFIVILLDDSENPGSNIQQVFKTIKKSDIDSSNLIQILNQAVKLLNTKNQSYSYDNNLGSIETISKALGDGLFSSDKLEALYKKTELDLKSELYILLPKPSKILPNIPYYEILNDIKHILASYSGGEAFQMDDGIMCILINDVSNPTEHSYNIYDSLLYELRRYLENKTNIHFTFFVSEVINLTNLSNKYQDLKEVYKFGYFDSILDIVDSHHPLPKSNIKSDPKQNINASDIIFILAQNDSFNLLKKIEEIYILTLKPSRDFSKALDCKLELELIYNSISFIFGIKLHEDSSPFFVSYESIEEECSAMKKAFITLNKQIHKRSKAVNPLILEAVVKVIDNLAENISLKWLAESINVTDTYLSHLFKKEIGMNFTTYLTNIRIIKAKGIIRSSNRKVYEIAEETGFLDYRYFSNVFRKITGVTPTEYRGIIFQENKAIPNNQQRDDLDESSSN